jgi:hypothetical protein
MAMQGMMTSNAHTYNWSDYKVAEWAYNTADAMLTARSSQEDAQ